MILLPIGRDESEIRRHAWVSYGIIAANILVFVLCSVVEHNYARGLDAKFEEAVGYWVQHPYLQLPPKLAAMIPDNVEAQIKARVRQIPPETTMHEQQLELEALADKALANWRELPTIRFGYIPAEGGVLTIFTSMFMHAGFLHIFGNLLFFFLSGPFIEDVFGRPLFALLYFIGGVVATLTYAKLNEGSAVPLVGASGAIAAVMGAYLVRFATSRVEFILIPFLFRPTFHFRFFLPAFVVLPLWFLQQLWEMTSEASGAGIAFSAHVGGFLFGIFFALAVKFAGVEEKFVNPHVEKETTWKADDRLLDVVEMRRSATYDEIKRPLAAVLRDDPGNVDALRLAVDIANENNDVPAVDTYAARLLGRYTELKQPELAMELVSELAGDRNGPPLPKFFARAAASLERAGDREWALYLYERTVAADPHGTGTISALIKIGGLLRAKGDVAGAKSALAKARAHPACTAEWAPSIDAKLAQLNARA